MKVPDSLRAWEDLKLGLVGAEPQGVQACCMHGGEGTGVGEAVGVQILE